MKNNKNDDTTGEQPEPWFNLAEGSKYLGVAPNTLRRWVKEKLVVSRRTPGGDFRFRLSELDQLLEQEPAD